MSIVCLGAGTQGRTEIPGVKARSVAPYLTPAGCTTGGSNSALPVYRTGPFHQLGRRAWWTWPGSNGRPSPCRGAATASAPQVLGWWFQGRSNPRLGVFSAALHRLSYGTVMEPSAGTDPALPLYRRGVPPSGDGMRADDGPRTRCLQFGRLALVHMSFICVEWLTGDDPATSALAKRRSTSVSYSHKMEVQPGVEPGYAVLQAAAYATRPLDHCCEGGVRTHIISG